MMESVTQYLAEHLVLGLLVLTRLSTLLMAMPAIGTGVPARIRAMLALVLTALLVPGLAPESASESVAAIQNLIDLAIAVAREALVGMLIGSTIQLIITGVQLGGEAITSTSGMQLGDAFDSASGSQIPSISRLMGLLATALMLLMGGHRILLGVLMDSFVSLPAGRVHFQESMLELLWSQLAAGTSAGVRVAAPVIATLLLSNVLTGLISRTLPQINVLAIGLSLNALAMLVVLALTIGSVGLICRDELLGLVQRINTAW
jgi:flagellar biosynthetic protein FliR